MIDIKIRHARKCFEAQLKFEHGMYFGYHGAKLQRKILIVVENMARKEDKLFN